MGASAQRQSTDEVPGLPRRPHRSLSEQSERNPMVILNLTRFPIGTYICAGRRI